MAHPGASIDIVEQALAVLDEECQVWAARKQVDTHAGEARRPGPGRPDQPRTEDGR